MKFWIGFGTGIGWTIAALYAWAIAQANKERSR